MVDNFEAALERILVHEGGYVDHPRDPGAATNKGVTLAVFRRFYGADKTTDDLRDITTEQLRHIYKTGYWDKCMCDDLPPGVDYVVFDQAVNSGPGRSARWLQRAVGAEVDGSIGPDTVSATQSVEAPVAVNQMCDERLEYLRRLPTWDTFGRGWTARVTGVRSHGLHLVTGDVRVSLPEDYDVVREGSAGPWVEKLQTALGLPVTGDFDAATREALEEYQREMGLEPDGIAGRITYRTLGLVA